MLKNLRMATSDSDSERNLDVDDENGVYQDSGGFRNRYNFIE